MKTLPRFAFAWLAGLLSLSLSASAVSHEVSIFLDLDNDASTGCTVTTVEGPFGGAEQVLVTTVETSGPPESGMVSGVGLAECLGPPPGTFGLPVVFDNDWPVGPGNGVSGRDVVESYAPLLSLVIADPSLVRVGVVVTDELGGEEALLTRNGAAGGAPIVLDAQALLEIPTLAEWGLILLALLVAVGSIALLGRRGTAALLLTLSALAAGVAWAAGSLDGLTEDWAGSDPLAAGRIVLFGEKGSDALFFRVDADLLFSQPPTITAVPDQTIPESGTTGPLAFTVGDAESPATSLVVTAISSNQTLVPDGNLTLAGSGVSRTIEVAPNPGQSGVTTVTLTVEDPDGGTASTAFDVTVTPVLTPATIRGQVLWSDADMLGVVPGAAVTLDGATTVEADERGMFSLEGVSPGPHSLIIQGPRAFDSDRPRVYGTRYVDVTTRAGELSSVSVALALGCERTFDASGPADLTVDACGGQGGLAALAFPAGALVDGAGMPFDGRALVEMAVWEPNAVQGMSAFTAGSVDEAAWPELAGAIEVRLSDAVTRAPLQVAPGNTATVSFEVSGGTQTGDVTLESFDPATGLWEPLPPGTVGSVSGIPVYTFAAEHFSAFRGRLQNVELTFLDTQAYFGPLQTCTGGCPQGSDCCGNTCCENQFDRRVSATVEWPGGTFDVADATPRCLPVPANTIVSFRMYSVQDDGLAGVEFRRLYETFPILLIPTPAPADECRPLDPAVTPDIGPVQLRARPLTCVSGDLASSTFCNVLSGKREVDVFLEDPELPSGVRHFSTEVETICGDPLDPADDFCIELPVDVSAHLVTAANHKLVETIDLGTEVVCPRPQGSGPFQACQDGTGVTVGDSLVRARMGLRVLSFDGAGYDLEIDASGSENALTFGFAGWNQPASPNDRAWYEASTTDAVYTAVNLEPGDYLAEVRAYQDPFASGVLRFLSDRATQGFTLPPPGHPVASFTTVPSAVAEKDETVVFDGTGSFDDVGITAYEWDFDNDGTVDDSSGPLVSHPYRSEGQFFARLRVEDGDGNSHEWLRAIEVVDTNPTLRVTILAGTGSVVSTPFVIDCDSALGGTCEAQFSPNEAVLLTAFATNTSCMVWGGDCALGNADGDKCVLTMDGDKDVTIDFSPCP